MISRSSLQSRSSWICAVMQASFDSHGLLKARRMCLVTFFSRSKFSHVSKHLNSRLMYANQSIYSTERGLYGVIGSFVAPRWSHASLMFYCFIAFTSGDSFMLQNSYKWSSYMKIILLNEMFKYQKLMFATELIFCKNSKSIWNQLTSRSASKNTTSRPLRFL